MKSHRYVPLALLLLFPSVAARADYLPSPDCWVVPPGLKPGDTYQVCFVTSTAKATTTSQVPSPTNFGNLYAADWIVTYTAYEAWALQVWDGRTPLVHAVLSDPTANAKDRISITEPLYNTHGDLIATDQADLWDGSIQNPVEYDEHGNPVTGSTLVWTGTMSNGDVYYGQTCGDWNISNNSASGSLGDATKSDNGWLLAKAQACSLTAHLTASPSRSPSPCLNPPRSSCWAWVP